MSILNCSYCSQRIRGQYVTWSDGTHACSECKRAFPTCSGCGKLSTTGEKICRSCMRTAIRCSVCTDFLVGRYVQFSNAMRLCSPCHRTLPRCARCEVPFVMGISHHGRSYCSSCYKDGIRCQLCDDICTGQYWQHPKVGVFCSSCKK